MAPKKVYGSICEVTAALSKVGVSKDRKNEQQGYKFRGIDDMYRALSHLLAEHRLCILPRVIDRQVTERQTKSGGALFYTTLTVEFDIVHAEDGSMHTVRMIGEAMDSGDKSSNKAQSSAYKYMAMEVFCIPTEGEDADATTHEVASKQSPWTKELLDLAKEAVKGGMPAYTTFWKSLSDECRSVLVQTDEHKEFKKQAAAVKAAA